MMHVKTKGAGLQRHCSPCWSFHLSAADPIFQARLLIVLSTCRARTEQLLEPPSVRGRASGSFIVLVAGDSGAAGLWLWSAG